MLLRGHPDGDSKDCRTSAPSLRMIAHRPSNESQSELPEPTSQADPARRFPKKFFTKCRAGCPPIANCLWPSRRSPTWQWGSWVLAEWIELTPTSTGSWGDVGPNCSLHREALTYSSRNSRLTMEIFLTTDRPAIASLLASRAENSQKISGRLQDLRSLCDSADEKRLLSAVESARDLTSRAIFRLCTS